MNNTCQSIIYEMYTSCSTYNIRVYEYIIISHTRFNMRARARARPSCVKQGLVHLPFANGARVGESW